MDSLLQDGVSKLFDRGVVGVMCGLLILLLIWQEKTNRKDLKDEREAHQKTRESHLADIKQFATLGESIRDQMKSVVMVTQAAIDLIKSDRGRK